MPELSGEGSGDRSRQGLAGPAGGKDRFDSERARRILQRAAAEQQRLNNELNDSYSFRELEEMAAEARISPEALRAALEADGRNAATAQVARPRATDDRQRRRLTALQKLRPRNWSTAVKGIVLTTAGVAFLGSMLAFPAIAEAVLWALLLVLILLSLLIVLGASPF